MLEKSKHILLTLLTLLSTVSFAAVNTQYKATVCGTGTYLFGCDKLTASGASYANTLGDSTVHLNLLFVPLKATQYNATIEPGQTYLFGCQLLSADATESNTLHQAGCECDSTVTLHLSVQAPMPTEVKVSYNATIATGEIYLFGCNQLTASGEYADTLHLAGKDSITILNLTVAAPTPTEVKVGYSATIATGEIYLFGCNQLTASGEYADTLHLAGKDSITILNLTVAAPTPTEVKVGYRDRKSTRLNSSH